MGNLIGVSTARPHRGGCVSSAVIAVVLLAACEQTLRQVEAETKDAAAPAFRFSVDAGDVAPSSTTDGVATCAEENYVAKPLPLDVFLVLDASGSMVHKVSDSPSSGTKWNAIQAALDAFISDPRSAGLGVGLQYLPDAKRSSTCLDSTECGRYGPCVIPRACSNDRTQACTTDDECGAGATCTRPGYCSTNESSCSNIGGACNGTGMCLASPARCEGYSNEELRCSKDAYATPAVPVIELPNGATQLRTSLMARTPEGDTPLGAAVAGGITYLQQRASREPGRRFLMVLATDGSPTACTPPDIPSISALLVKARKDRPNISTYVIGVLGRAERNTGGIAVNALAAAGGSDMALIVSSSQDLSDKFLDALNQIRAAATLPCEYPIPNLQRDVVDYLKVNVVFVSTGNDTVRLGQVANQARCNPLTGGWYYDGDPASGKPGRILLCESTCEGLKRDSGGRLEIRYGCATKVIE